MAEYRFDWHEDYGSTSTLSDASSNDSTYWTKFDAPSDLEARERVEQDMRKRVAGGGPVCYIDSLRGPNGLVETEKVFFPKNEE